MGELKDILSRELGGAVAMLENAIRACPEELWSRPSEEMGFWYLAYHTAFFLDFDFFRGKPEEFRSQPFDIHQYEAKILAPPYDDPYSKEDVLQYIARGKRIINELLQSESLTSSAFLGCERLDITLAELAIYHTRHVQHGAAQLNLLLRQTVNDAPGWVRSRALDAA